MNEKKEQQKNKYIIVAHECYEPDQYRVYDLTDYRDIEYLEKNPSMYTIVKQKITFDEVNLFFKNLED